MVKRVAKRIYRKMTAAELERWKKAVEETEREKPEILAWGREVVKAHKAAICQLQHAFSLLKLERQAKGISLAELRSKTGIGRSALSRLENNPEANPTITTLARVADALGKQVVIQLVDKPKGSNGR